MGEQDPRRRAAQYELDRLAEQDRAAADDDAPARPAGPRPPTMAGRGAFADELVRQAMARGEFDDLPLTGKPIPGLSGRYDPDWWLKSFIEREQITGVLPEALQLRKDDAVLDDALDLEPTEARVREAVAEFNARIVEARRQLLGGPPVVTPLRDVDAEVAQWSARREARWADTATRPDAEGTSATGRARDRLFLTAASRLRGARRSRRRSRGTSAR